MIRPSILFVSLLALLYLGAAPPPPSLSTKSNTTAQIPDLLVLAEDTLGIFSNPLESFFDEENPRPEQIFPGGCSTTACWRGYQATWRILDDALFLIAIADCCGGARLSVAELDSLLDGRFKAGKAWADWFTGHILIPDGELVEYMHMGYGSTYEQYIILRVEDGVVTKSWEANQRQFLRFRKAQFELFKKTDIYTEAFTSLSEGEDADEEELISFIFNYYSEVYTSMVFDE